MMDKLLFLGFFVGADDIHVNEEKVRAIKDWLVPKTVSEVCSFHELATLYRRFIRKLNNIVALITKCMKKESLMREMRQKNNIVFIKEKFSALVLALLNFNKLFEVECDDFGVGLGGILS